MNNIQKEDTKTGAQRMIESLVKGILGAENFDAVQTAVPEIMHATKEVVDVQKRILCAVENLSDRLGRVEAALRIPREEEREGATINGKSSH
jgi:hypothetical protein